MLPDISLDDENYDEILDEAKNMIINLYPEWTDFNEHDPGITLLELFAMLKESQQFYADRVGEENKKKYLKLLGIRRKNKKAAHSLVWIESEENYQLLRNHKLGADGLIFENIRKKQIVKGDITHCIAACDGQAEAMISIEEIEFGNMFHFCVFGENARPGKQFYLCCDKPLPLKVQLDLYIQVYQEYRIKRNPLRDCGFVPLVQIRWQYYTDKGWKNLENVQDETHAFLFDGFIRFTLEDAMEEHSVCGRVGYFIRAVLWEGEYDVPPILTRISLNICEVVQKDTLAEYIIQEKVQSSIKMDTELALLGKSEVYFEKNNIFYPVADFGKETCQKERAVKITVKDERIADADRIMVINRDLSYLYKRIIGVGNGFPYQEIDLEDLQVIYESFEILVQDLENGDGYSMWHKVEDFANSSSGDKHYIFDSRRGILHFGDCIHGMAPEGEIILAGCVRTRGRDGSVKTGKINHFCREGMGNLTLTNICDGFGACDEESLEESFLRARRSIKESKCAVTRQDYEKYARQTPGLMVESCKVLNPDDVRQFMKKIDETAVYMVVKPYAINMGESAKRSYTQNIKAYLERYRMIGSQIVLFFPEYVEMEVYVEVTVKPQYHHIEERVKQAVRDFFDIYKGEFGSVISYGRLYGFLDRKEFILGIRSLEMECKSIGIKRNTEGDILLSPYGIAVLKEVRTFLL